MARTLSLNLHVERNILKTLNEDFYRGCGIQISDTEVLLIGGQKTQQTILKLDIETNKQMKIGQLIQGRYFHSCTKFGDTIIITGGKKSLDEVLMSTELLDLKTFTLKAGPNLNKGRFGHGLITVNYNDKKVVLALGGVDFQNELTWINSLEIWHPNNGTWKLSCKTSPLFV